MVTAADRDTGRYTNSVKPWRNVLYVCMDCVQLYSDVFVYAAVQQEVDMKVAKC